MCLTKKGPLCQTFIKIEFLPTVDRLDTILLCIMLEAGRVKSSHGFGFWYCLRLPYTPSEQ